MIGGVGPRARTGVVAAEPKSVSSSTQLAQPLMQHWGLGVAVHESGKMLVNGDAGRGGGSTLAARVRGHRPSRRTTRSPRSPTEAIAETRTQKE